MTVTRASSYKSVNSYVSYWCSAKQFQNRSQVEEAGGSLPAKLSPKTSRMSRDSECVAQQQKQWSAAELQCHVIHWPITQYVAWSCSTSLHTLITIQILHAGNPDSLVLGLSLVFNVLSRVVNNVHSNLSRFCRSLAVTGPWLCCQTKLHAIILCAWHSNYQTH